MSADPSYEVLFDPEGVAWLSGEIDMMNADLFYQHVSAKRDGRPVVLEASALTFIDSSGIRALIRFARETDERVVFRNPRANVRKVLEIAGANESLGIRIEPE